VKGAFQALNISVPGQIGKAFSQNFDCMHGVLFDFSKRYWDGRWALILHYHASAESEYSFIKH